MNGVPCRTEDHLTNIQENKSGYQNKRLISCLRSETQVKSIENSLRKSVLFNGLSLQIKFCIQTKTYSKIIQVNAD